jgi:nucleoside-diphosphate-sugar epimerase
MAVVRRRDTDETAREAGERRARWLAAARNGYDKSWLPESVVANLDHVHVDDRHQAVIVVLWSDTRIVDQLDRVDIVGTADDVSVGELAEAVLRRGWTKVDVHGPAALHRAVSQVLQTFTPPSAMDDSWPNRHGFQP